YCPCAGRRLREGGGPLRRLGQPSVSAGPVFIIDQDARGCAVKVLILPAFQRPEEGGQAEPAQEQGDRDQIDEDRHLAGSIVPKAWRAPPSLDGALAVVFSAPLRRSALDTTSTEDNDMESAATRGVT